MNLTQVKYARDRAAATLKKRRAAITAKHTTPAVKLTKAQKLEALKCGLYTVSPDKGRYGWADSIDFTEERPEEVNTAALEADLAALDAAYRQLEDELVLGDNEAALGLLRAFEAEAAQ